MYILYSPEIYLKYIQYTEYATDLMHLSMYCPTTPHLGTMEVSIRDLTRNACPVEGGLTHSSQYTYSTIIAIKYISNVTPWWSWGQQVGIWHSSHPHTRRFDKPVSQSPPYPYCALVGVGGAIHWLACALCPWMALLLMCRYSEEAQREIGQPGCGDHAVAWVHTNPPEGREVGWNGMYMHVYIPLKETSIQSDVLYM